MLKSFYTNEIKNGAFKGSVLFFCVAIALCFISASNSYAFEGKVKYVVDGDTFVLQSGEKVRLASIDTPEVGRNGKVDQYYAKEATDLLSELILNKVVTVTPVKGKKESYGRVVGWVYLGKSFINKEMVSKGAAFYYYHPHNDAGKQDLLLEAQIIAMSSAKGFWTKISAMEDFNIKWVGNLRSRRCFREGSNFSVTVMSRNRVHFSNLGEAFMAGYTPARATKFWPEVKK
ncbi:thermonuclease family protein [Maridesulfovibrio frigidus]|uniref:thermonuclease family protein n=1 Tax=Maridesulfovibrio frigidus TaxID=340956 RepID=UPI000A8234FB|nr:thermonuclease family protein [Maridesulfovibrio frigidus]